MSYVHTHVECPCGKSSDAYSVNSDGWGTCFSCGKRFAPTKSQEHLEEKTNKGLKMDTTQTDTKDFRFYPHRGISEAAFIKYNASVRFIDNEPYEIGFIYPNGAVKVRSMNGRKDFRSFGPMKDANLFGMDKFPAGGDVITLVEGEYDAIAAWDMLRSPVVSVRGSSSAKVDTKKQFEYINSFKKIVLAFDNDAPGQSAERSVAGIFDFNKVYRMDFGQFKDPNEFLQNSSSEEFIKRWKAAKKYTPDSIINTFEQIAQSLSENKEECIGTYPFESLQNALHGLYKGDMVVFKGNEGIGKTEVFRAIEHHLLKTEKDAKLLIIHMEETKATTIKGIATYEDQFPHIHLKANSSKEDIMKAYQKAVGDENRVFLYDSYDVEDDGALLDNIRFMVKNFGVNFVFLDHITWLATGMDGDENERRKLDRISQKIKLLAKELGFAFILISHTNDEGKTRGSRNITKVANTVVHLSRDLTSSNPEEKCKTWFMVEKGRGGGTITGPAGYAIFEDSTLTLKTPPTKVFSAELIE